MFTCQVRERDPTLETSLRPTDERIMTNLFDSPSMESTSNRMPLINLNRSIRSVEQSLKSLSGDLQTIRQQMKPVVEYTSHNLINLTAASNTNGLKQQQQQHASITANTDSNRALQRRHQQRRQPTGLILDTNGSEGSNDDDGSEVDNR